MSSSTIKLTDPQRAMLKKAAANADGKAPAGLMDGPKRTARKLEELGLGETYFYGCLMFRINEAGRELAATITGRITGRQS